MDAVQNARLVTEALLLTEFFESYRSGDGYDRAAITHVMACSSHFPGYLIQHHA
jgi:hypothetical protein